jgi:hypothetical protein
MWMGEWGPTQKILISKWPKCPGGIISTKLFQLIHPFNFEISYFFFLNLSQIKFSFPIPMNRRNSPAGGIFESHEQAEFPKEAEFPH